MLLLDAIVAVLGRETEVCSDRNTEDLQNVKVFSAKQQHGEKSMEELKAGDEVDGQSGKSNADADEFSTDLPLEAIFSNLVVNQRKAGDDNDQPSSSASSVFGPFGWEAEAEYSRKQATDREEEIAPDGESLWPLSPSPLPSYNSPVLINTSPVSNSSRDSSKSSTTFAGIIKGLIQNKSGPKASFKFSEENEDHEKYSNPSPTTVFDAHGTGSSSSEYSPAPVFKDLNSILPFPASFPSVKSPVEALMLANSFSFSMSRAVPESPGLQAVSPLSFDTGSPCEHLLPGRSDFYNVNSRTKSGPQRLYSTKGSSTSAWSLSKSISFNGNDLCLPRKSNATYRSKSLTVHSTSGSQPKVVLPNSSVPSRCSSKSSNTNTTISSEFSIELSGRLCGTAAELNSSRYIELDFNKHEAPPVATAAPVSQADRENVYDVKSDIRSRVEEVVRNTDDSKFTFSPIASSFLFAKSRSRDANSGPFSGNLEVFMERQPEQAAPGSPRKKLSLVQRMSRNGSMRSSQHHEETDKAKRSWFWWIHCCTRSKG